MSDYRCCHREEENIVKKKKVAKIYVLKEYRYFLIVNKCKLLYSSKFACRSNEVESRIKIGRRTTSPRNKTFIHNRR